MLDAAKRAGLLCGGGKARTDSTHVLAKISALGRLERVGETVRAALNQLAQVAPGWLAPRIDPEWEQRYGRRIDSAHLPAAEQARDRFGQAVAADGAVLLAAIDADPDAAWLNNLPAIDALRKIWDQECVLDQHGAWMLRHGRIREGADFRESPFDLDSRWSRKRDTTWQGYKAHLTETCDTSDPHLIIAVRTTPATDTDNATLPSINADLQARDLTPAEHYLDEGYVTADAVARAAGQGTEIIGPLARDTSWQARAGQGFDRDSFRLDFDSRTDICPAGKISTTWKPRAHNSGPGTAIAFADTDCRPCPMRAHCTTSTTTGRQIVIPSRELYEIQLTNRAARNDPDWQRRYNTRAGIEGTISQAARAHHLRRNRYTGLPKTRVQHVLTACGMNAAGSPTGPTATTNPPPPGPEHPSRASARQPRSQRVSQQSPRIPSAWPLRRVSQQSPESR
ncbi:transposase [Micromonospora sp. DT4]|uniref:transposase n=1 Tax=Micromonospora sp. DT4 TaxID=3393438 RepID=UPI003CF04797